MLNITDLLIKMMNYFSVININNIMYFSIFLAINHQIIFKTLKNTLFNMHALYLNILFIT